MTSPPQRGVNQLLPEGSSILAGRRRLFPLLTRSAGRPGRGRRGGEAITGLLFIAPVTLGLVIFQLWPLLRGGYLSLTESGYFGGSTFVGLENFRRLLTDTEVLRAFVNSAVYTLVLLLGVPLGIVVAALMNTRRLRLKSTYRALFFLPVVTIPAAAGLAWGTLLNGEYGPLNQALELFGIEGRNWLQDPATALLAVAVVGIWSSLGYNIVMFMAGLQGIPRELYEAAELDGAGRVRQFLSVTLPLLTPTTFFVSVTTVIGAMQMFDLMYIMVGARIGGNLRNPAIDDAQTVVYLFYTYGFVENDRGFASTIAVALLILVIGLTAVQFRLQRRWVHYD